MRNLTDALQKIVTPPSFPTSNGGFDRFIEIETELGLQLPSDYKDLIIAYGDGCWQGFWYLLNPFTENKYLNLITQASQDGSSGYDILSAKRSVRNLVTDYPHKIWPEENGIFPWGMTDNGGRFFWITRGNADDWPTIYYPSRDPDFERYELSVSEIILGAISGTLPIFSDEFDGKVVPAGKPLFEKLSA